jgi:SAM-dependent methyltransferase
MNASPPVSDTPIRYEGTANLEAMAEARNYNRYLAGLVTSWVKPESAVADFGAGIGTFAALVRPLVARLICIEPDPDQSQRLQAQGFEALSSLASVPDHSLDLIYTLNVLEHIPDDQAALREIQKKLREGGRLLVYVPAWPVLFSDMDRLVGHVRRYRLKELTEKVVAAGFDVQIARYADCAGFFATLAYRLQGRGGGRLSPAAVATYDRYVFPVSKVLDGAGASRLVGKNAFVVATAQRRNPDR